MLGGTIAHYTITDKIGEGGMGEVYRATDTKLKREVALKVLPESFTGNPQRLARFQREAEVLASLNHPNIGAIYGLEESDTCQVLVLEMVEGETLAQRMAKGPIPIEEALRIGLQTSQALEAAHEKGIIHRDLKPANLMVTSTGRVKVLDFGLAKQIPAGGADALTQLTTILPATERGALLGTVPYMSPEQAAGRSVSHATDQFSFGVLMYEMLGGRRPFVGSSTVAVLNAVLRDTPPALRSLRPEIPRELEQVVHNCLKKDPESRYSSTGELTNALRHCQECLSLPPRGLVVGRRTVAAAVALFALALVSAAWHWFRDDAILWMERATLAEITRFTENGELWEAFRLLHSLPESISDDSRIQRLRDRFTLPISIVTEPAGAEVQLTEYASPDSPWVSLGETPLHGVRIPYALTHWRISKDGYETFEGAPFGERPATAFARGFVLDPEGARPGGMVRVPGGPYVRPGFPPVELADYWLDRYEVTNRQFKEFVDAGGYQREEYWTEPFMEGERELSHQEAMARFVDRTGQPGPAGWEFGAYDAGEADFPVGGVSWYEAAAYCRSVGKSLPTLFHWSAAAVQDQLSDIVLVSNFGNEGPEPVGSRPGLGDFGTYDMAGNVKEWCWNEAGGHRYILGGAWGEPSYFFRINADSQPPFSREPTHGVRCSWHQTPPGAELMAPVKSSGSVHDSGQNQPVPEEIFEIYRGLYAYDPSELEAAVESVDESSPHWRKETISFKAAYGGERVIAHLFLPRNAEPPFQVVAWYPGNDAFMMPAGESLASRHLFDFIPRSGRALAYPVYKGTYERRVPFSFAPNEWRDMIILWSKDLSRTVDYLEERSDMDTDKLAFYGFSAGAVYGPVFTAVDKRFKASVLFGAGLVADIPPEANPVNFAPRSRAATLMVNGENDFLYPFETAQRPFFRLLGVPEDQKRHARLEGGHIPRNRLELIEEVVGWLDRHLGPVAPTRSTGMTADRQR